MKLDRRSVLTGTGSLVAASIAPRLAMAGTTLPAAPVAKVKVVKDTYFGETLSDPYRWMENDKDPDWLPFLKGQNAYTRSILDKLPGRDALLKRIEGLSGDTITTAKVQR